MSLERKTYICSHCRRFFFVETEALLHERNCLAMKRIRTLRGNFLKHFDFLNLLLVDSDSLEKVFPHLRGQNFLRDRSGKFIICKSQKATCSLEHALDLRNLDNHLSLNPDVQMVFSLIVWFPVDLNEKFKSGMMTYTFFAKFFGSRSELEEGALAFLDFRHCCFDGLPFVWRYLKLVMEDEVTFIFSESVNSNGEVEICYEK